VTVWCKQLEKILAESERMRKEADDTGPRAELDHWRQMSSRYHVMSHRVTLCHIMLHGLIFVINS